MCIKYCLLALSLATSLYSCKKYNTQENTAKAPAQNHSYSPLTTIGAVNLNLFEPNNMSWNDIAEAQDMQDEAFRKAKLFYSIGLAEIVKDPVIASWIYNQAMAAENKAIYLEDVFAQFQGTKALVQAAVDPYGVMTGWSFEQVQAQMQYDNFDIKPAIFLANADNANGATKPVVSPGFDLNLDDSTHNSDVVLAWHIDDLNVITKINLWESLANTIEAPVLCIDGLATNLNSVNADPEPNLTTGRTTQYFPTDHPNMRLTVTRYRIGYRYDASARSEVCIEARRVGVNDPTNNVSPGVVMNFLRINCFTGVISGYQLVDLHKRDINKTRSIDRYFGKAHSPWPLSLYNGEYDHYMTSPASGSKLMNRKFLVYNMYERDWFASDKKLAFFRINGNSANDVRLSGKMSKYNEWYLFDPNDNFMPHTINLPYPYIGWTRDNFHPKGDLRIVINNHCTY